MKQLKLFLITFYEKKFNFNILKKLIYMLKKTLKILIQLLHFFLDKINDG